MMPTPVILLKEGTDSSQGIPQLVSNISACQVIAEAVRTTLGPRGMDKLIVDGRVSEAGETLCGGRFTPPDHHSSFPHSHPAGMAVLINLLLGLDTFTFPLGRGISFQEC
uniref:Chaperonin containing TCP1 subunit 7 n=1 Tax=Gorilla gorilla gorilla TaxID=9595 RepID=A0A2I2ZVF2_GORGO